MQTKPFAMKQIAKEKEVTSEKFTKEPIKDQKEKHEKNESKDNQDTKVHKDQKDHKDQKEQKEQKEHKEQKEKQEKDGKNEHKDKLEKEKHEKELKERKEHSPKEQLAKETQAEKLPEFQMQPQPEEATLAATQGAASAEAISSKFVEHKVHKDKFEKFEKIEKVEKIEKLEHKEIEKFFEGPQDPGGPVESRLAALEASMAQLMHFIPASLRPDLSQGALKQEPDVAPAAAPAGDAPPAADPAAESKKDDKKK